MLEASIAVDINPRDTIWAANDEKRIAQFEGGPHEESRNTFYDKKFSSSSSYDFATLDSEGDGICD